MDFEEILDQYVDRMDSYYKSDESKDLNKFERVKDIESYYGIEYAFLRLTINMLNQVNNGGFTQYVENGYHSSEMRGCTSDLSDNSDMHDKLIELAGKIKHKYVGNDIDAELPSDFSEFESIIKEFGNAFERNKEEQIDVLCDYCGGEGCDECDDGYTYEDNPDFGSLSDRSRESFDKLDERLYKINDKFIEELAMFYEKNVPLIEPSLNKNNNIRPRP